VPAIFTTVPACPLVGLKLVIVGGGGVPELTVKEVPLVAVPAAFVTAMGPDVAFAGTAAVSWLAEITAKLAFEPLNVTALAPLKFEPFTVTVVPEGPAEGLKVAICGRLLFPPSIPSDGAGCACAACTATAAHTEAARAMIASAGPLNPFDVLDLIGLPGQTNPAGVFIGRVARSVIP